LRSSWRQLFTRIPQSAIFRRDKEWAKWLLSINGRNWRQKFLNPMTQGYSYARAKAWLLIRAL